MKKFLKSRMFIIVITALVCITGSVYATTQILAKDVSYTPKDSSWNVDNAKDALDGLYTIASTYKKLSTTTTASASDILSGKTAYDNNGNLVTGTYNGNCSYGTFTCDSSCENSTGFKIVSFSPIYFFVDEYSNSGTINSIDMFNKNIDSTYAYTFGASGYSKYKISDYFKYSSGSFRLYNYSGANGKIFHYVTCK